MLIADFFQRRGLCDKVEVHLFTPEPQPTPAADPALGQAVTQMLESNGVMFRPLHKLTAVDGAARELALRVQT